MKVLYTNRFLRDLKALPEDLRDEVSEKIERFKDRGNHKALKVHKLHGSLVGYYSFSVNFKYRVLFSYDSHKDAILAAVDDHSMYE